MNKKFSFGMISLIGLFALSLFFSTYKLPESPSVWYDEGWYIQTSANWLRFGVDGLQAAPDDIRHIAVLSVGYPLLYPLSLWFGIFGTSVVAARSLMVIFILSFLATAYFLVRRLYGARLGIWTLALLATFPPLYGNGKSVLGEVPGLFYMMAALICISVATGQTRRRSLWLAISGVLAGLCVTTKPVFLLLLPAMAVAVFIWRKRINVLPKEILWTAIGFAAPVAVWMAIQFPQGSSVVEVLGFYANPYNFSHIFLVILTNIVRLFSDTGPLYTLLLAIVWSWSIVVRWRRKETIPFPEVVAFMFSVLVIAAYLRTAGLYRYLFYAQGASIVFFPNALSILLGHFDEAIKRTRLFGSQSLLVVSLFALSVLGLYQLSFDSWVADGYESKKTAYWQGYFADLPQEIKMFFYDVPEVVPFMSGNQYRQALRTPAAIPFAQDQVAFLKGGWSDKVITTTAIFKENRDGLFDGYYLEKESYKYSILSKKI